MLRAQLGIGQETFNPAGALVSTGSPSPALTINPMEGLFEAQGDCVGFHSNPRSLHLAAATTSRWCCDLSLNHRPLPRSLAAPMLLGAAHQRASHRGN